MRRGRKKGSTEKTIGQLFKENEEILKKAGYDKSIFEANMRVIMKENNKRVPGAWKIFKHKTDFTDKTIIGAENMIQGMKKLSKDDYNAFRKEVIGWKNKVDYSKFEYDDVTGKYKYKKSDTEIYEIELITGSYGSQYWTWRKL